MYNREGVLPSSHGGSACRHRGSAIMSIAHQSSSMADKRLRLISFLRMQIMPCIAERRVVYCRPHNRARFHAEALNNHLCEKRQFPGDDLFSIIRNKP